MATKKTAAKAATKKPVAKKATAKKATPKKSSAKQTKPPKKYGTQWCLTPFLPSVVCQRPTLPMVSLGLITVGNMIVRQIYALEDVCLKYLVGQAGG
jgi:hypothetical protein